MAVKLADAVAYLTTDDTQLKKGMSSAESTMQSSGSKFGSILQGVGMAVGMGVANLAVSAATSFVGFATDGIGMASDLGETMSKVGVVFGENATQVKAWAADAATALGQSQSEALGAAATFGNLFVSMGMGKDTSADMSMDLVQLATDLASFNNIDPSIALEKLRAGMLGQSEPMQALGVNMTAAMVSAKAMEMGLAATTEELTPAMLAQARYAIILEQTTTAQGDFARTSDGLANQQRIADAQWKELQTTLGGALLPVLTAVTTALNKLMADVLPPISKFINEQLTPAMRSIGTAVQPAVDLAMNLFRQLGATMNQQATGPMSNLSRWFSENMPRIQLIVQNVTNAITQFWTDHGARIMAVVGPLLNWLVSFWQNNMQTTLDIVSAILQLLTGDFEGAGETMRGIVSRWWEFFRDAFDAIRRQVTGIDWGGIGRSIIDAFWRGMRASWGVVEDWFNDRLQELRNQLPFSEPRDPDSPLRGLADSGAAMVNQIRTGIQSAAALTVPSLNLPTAGAAAGGMNITINVNGYADGAGVGGAARDGLLSALRAAGLR